MGFILPDNKCLWSRHLVSMSSAHCRDFQDCSYRQGWKQRSPVTTISIACKYCLCKLTQKRPLTEQTSNKQ